MRCRRHPCRAARRAPLLRPKDRARRSSASLPRGCQTARGAGRSSAVPHSTSRRSGCPHAPDATAFRDFDSVGENATRVGEGDEFEETHFVFRRRQVRRGEQRRAALLGQPRTATAQIVTSPALSARPTPPQTPQTLDPPSVWFVDRAERHNSAQAAVGTAASATVAIAPAEVVAASCDRNLGRTSLRDGAIMPQRRFLRQRWSRCFATRPLGGVLQPCLPTGGVALAAHDLAASSGAARFDDLRGSSVTRSMSRT